MSISTIGHRQDCFTGMLACMSGLVDQCRKFLRRAERHALLVLVTIGEWNTSTTSYIFENIKFRLWNWSSLPQVISYVGQKICTRSLFKSDRRMARRFANSAILYGNVTQYCQKYALYCRSARKWRMTWNISQTNGRTTVVVAETTDVYWRVNNDRDSINSTWN